MLGKLSQTRWTKQSLLRLRPKNNTKNIKKRMKYSTKLKAHDEKNIAKEGDIVRIMETRPLSKEKRFRLVEVVEEAVVL